MRAFNIITTVRHEITDAEHALVTNMSDNKVKAIKFIREQHGLGLKEAKDICDCIWFGHSSGATEIAR